MYVPQVIDASLDAYTVYSKRVFILGPSHHLYIQGCALSKCKEYKTPIGNLPLDLESMFGRTELKTPQ